MLAGASQVWRKADLSDRRSLGPLTTKFRVPVGILLGFVLLHFLFFSSGNKVSIAPLTHNPDSPKETHPSSDQNEHAHAHAEFHKRPHATHDSHNSQCRGPRGLPLEEGIAEDLPQRAVDLHGHEYTNATYGSYDSLRLEQTWMTFEQRYGPYGFNEDHETYNFSRVDWSQVDWAGLQDECSRAQHRPLYKGYFIPPEGQPRLHVRHHRPFPFEVDGKTGRQAIVLRAWDSYEYTAEDLWNIRSIITEASLATGAEYTVYLMVHVKSDAGAEIHHNTTHYHHVLQQAVPEEFRSIAVLFHQSLLENWYPKVEEYTPFWQIMQPLQLFALFYPEYDHYWQFEMDTRFTGHVGKMLQAFHEFGKQQPYKQSRERASWTYMPKLHGTYEEFSASINASLKGSATVWGPVRGLPAELGPPMSPIPPDSQAKDDPFLGGVGTDPDLLLLDHLIDTDRFEEGFMFREWFRGIDADVPRFHSPVAQVRVSKSLLAAVHKAQLELGIRLPGEATMPSFALWHGLQLAQIPHPRFLFPERNLRELEHIHNGGNLTAFSNGIANATGTYYRHYLDFYSRPTTYDFKSSLPDPTFERWMEGGHFGPSDRDMRTWKEMRPPAQMGEIPDGLPGFMREVDGRVYVPNMILHPRKTNSKKKLAAAE